MKEIQAITIKGKEYITVNERLKAFRSLEAYKDYSLESEIVAMSENDVTIRAVIKNGDGRIIATGYANEVKDNSNMINKTSYLENCETSAWGRALGNLGIGIDTSISSAEEVATAINQQQILQDIEKKLDKELLKEAEQLGMDLLRVKAHYKKIDNDVLADAIKMKKEVKVKNVSSFKGE